LPPPLGRRLNNGCSEEAAEAVGSPNGHIVVRLTYSLPYCEKILALALARDVRSQIVKDCLAPSVATSLYQSELQACGVAVTADLTQNVDAICPEAREMVRAAARRAGFSVREWLNSIIIKAAEEVGAPTVPSIFEEFDEPVSSRKHNLAEVHSRLEDLAEQIEWLVQQNSNSS
jgi:hypothetical protein